MSRQGEEMPYSELVKNFNKIREYMRDFYVYGFKSRDGFSGRSTRTYDDERRRIESWLSDYMQFQMTSDGKVVSISIDSRRRGHNPFYKAWKTKSFTDGDITLHFILMDILPEGGREEEADSPGTDQVPAGHEAAEGLTIGEIVDRVDDVLLEFPGARTFDESTIRKKLKEYCQEGIVLSEKCGRTVRYRRAGSPVPIDAQALHFFSEVAPCGVIGAYCADKQEEEKSLFTFKHHYITSAMDSEILCEIFLAMRKKNFMTVETVLPKEKRSRKGIFVPLQVRVSAQSGRQHLMAYSYESRRIVPLRIDHIVSACAGGVCAEYDQYRKAYEKIAPTVWGVSTHSWSGKRMEHVEFTVRFGPGEEYIYGRLLREKRVGSVELLDPEHARFRADVCDASELVPWMRTFIGRLSEVHFSNPVLEEKFKSDIGQMYAMYGIRSGEGGES